MKSLIKSINTNCCYEGSDMIKNKSQKELSFDIRAKSFSIVDIKHIRKNYRKHKLIETSLGGGQFNAQENHQLGESQKIQGQNVEQTKVSQHQQNSLLSVYCQKVSKITQQQMSLYFNQKSKETKDYRQNRSFNNVQSTKAQIRRQKIQITCGKSNLSNIGQIRKRLSHGYLKIDGNRKISQKQQIDSSFVVEKDKRFSMQIEPNLDIYKQSPQYFIQKPSFASRESQKDLQTTVENSQSDPFANKPHIYVKNTLSKVQKAQQIYSKVTAVNERDLRIENRQSFGQVDKENDMSLVNRRISTHKEMEKGKPYNICEAKTSDRQQKVTESILFTQKQSPYSKVNLSINSQILEPQTSILAIKKQIDSLQKQYGQLKIQESFLLNQIQENHNEFQAKYQILLEKKEQCQIQERKRRHEIDEIKKLLQQRAQQLSENPFKS